MFEKKSQFFVAYKKLLAFFAVFGVVSGLLLLVEPRLVGLLVWPFGLIAYASVDQPRQPEWWLFVYIALSLTSLILALAICFIVGIFVGRTGEQLLVLCVAAILLFVAIVIATTSIHIVVRVLNKLKR